MRKELSDACQKLKMPVGEPNQNLYNGSFTIEGGNFNCADIVLNQYQIHPAKAGNSRRSGRKPQSFPTKAEINVVSYAKKAVVNLMVVPGSVNIEVVIIEKGRVIPNDEQRCRKADSWPSANPGMGFGAGMGLCNIKIIPANSTFPRNRQRAPI